MFVQRYRSTVLSGEEGRHFGGVRLSEAENITGVTSSRPHIIVSIIGEFTLPVIIGGNSYNSRNIFYP
jgi:hypothetical protein